MSDIKPPPVSKARIAIGITAIVVGVAFFVYAGADDSPGGQGLGALVVFLGIWRLVKSRKRPPAPTRQA